MKYQQTKIKKPCRECGAATRIRFTLAGIEFPLCQACLLAMASIISNMLEDRAYD